MVAIAPRQHHHASGRLRVLSASLSIARAGSEAFQAVHQSNHVRLDAVNCDPDAIDVYIHRPTGAI
jgi:hypothetical protein